MKLPKSKPVSKYFFNPHTRVYTEREVKALMDDLNERKAVEWQKYKEYKTAHGPILQDVIIIHKGNLDLTAYKRIYNIYLYRKTWIAKLVKFIVSIHERKNIW